MPGLETFREVAKCQVLMHNNCCYKCASCRTGSLARE